jgi:hypothetical protein
MKTSATESINGIHMYCETHGEGEPLDALFSRAGPRDHAPVRQMTVETRTQEEWRESPIFGDLTKNFVETSLTFLRGE